MATERARTTHRRSISELQRDAPEIVREASERGEVEITRYGETVAYVISPSERSRREKMDAAAERAIWAIDFQRAMKDLKEGAVIDWEEVITRLRAIVNKK